jgi:hypothetical protein
LELLASYSDHVVVPGVKWVNGEPSGTTTQINNTPVLLPQVSDIVAFAVMAEHNVFGVPDHFVCETGIMYCETDLPPPNNIISVVEPGNTVPQVVRATRVKSVMFYGYLEVVPNSCNADATFHYLVFGEPSKPTVKVGEGQIYKGKVP